MPKLFGTLKKEHKGITGLETAIILIAFVIVASVLAYVVISSGLFSSQKAKAAVNAGLEQTGATLDKCRCCISSNFYYQSIRSAHIEKHAIK